MHTKPTPFQLFAGLVLLLSSALVLTAGATASRPPAQATAIATVDIMNIIDGLNERGVLEQQLDDRMAGRQAKLDEVVEQLKVLEADVQMLTRGTDEHREKLREGMEKQAVAQARREALSQIASIDMGEVMAGLYTKVELAIQNIAEREGYDVVLFDDTSFDLPEGSPNPDVVRAIITKSVIYRHDSVDITQQVITLMNNEYNAP